MKNILKSALLVTALTNLLAAEVVFDLGAQQFYNSVEQNYQDSTYDLTNSIASTGLAYIDGAYRPKIGSSGSLSVQLKEPKPNWGVTFDMYCYLFEAGCSVTLLGANGNTIDISLIRYNINVEGQNFHIGDFQLAEVISGTVQTVNNTVEIVINGQHKFTVTKANFSLAHVNITMNGAELGAARPDTADKLNSLAISNSN